MLILSPYEKFRQTSQISNPCSIFDIPTVTPMGLEPITRGLKDRYSSQLSYEVKLNQRKRWESNPHESLAPNCFQDSDHRPLACSSFYFSFEENKGIEPSPQQIEDSLSRRAQQTNICLFSIFCSLHVLLYTFYVSIHNSLP